MIENEALEEFLEGLTEASLSRRELLRRAGLGAGTLAAAGLLAASAQGARRAGGKRGGRLLVGVDADAYRTTGPRANVGQYPHNLNIYESLARMTPDYDVIPWLATSWEFKPPNTWRIQLRKGVKFHDGSPFTAEDVKFAFDRIASAGGGTPGLGPNSTVIVDPFTVEVTPKFENRRFIEQIVHPQNAIIKQGSQPGTSTVGTGPFKLARYSPQEEISVRRFGEYWGKKALLDELVFKFLPDPNARRLALEAGDVDLIFDAPREAVADLKRRGFAIATSQVGAYEAMYAKIGAKAGFSLLHKEPAVRKAIGYAIDRDALVKGVYEGLAANEQTMVPKRLLGPASFVIHGYTFNRDKSKKLLDGAGWGPGGDGIRVKGGQRLSLTLVDGFPSAQDHGAVPEFVQDQLKRVGIEVKIVKTPDNASYEQRLDAGDGDLWLELGNQNDANPVFLPALLFWSVGIFGDIGYQPLFAPDGRFDTLIVRALANPDSKKVKAITADALHLLIDQDAIVIPLAGIFRIFATKKSVMGFEPHPSRLQIRWEGVSIA